MKLYFSRENQVFRNKVYHLAKKSHFSGQQSKSILEFWAKILENGFFSMKKGGGLFFKPPVSQKSAFYTSGDNPGHKVLRIFQNYTRIWMHSIAKCPDFSR